MPPADSAHGQRFSLGAGLRWADGCIKPLGHTARRGQARAHVRVHVHSGASKTQGKHIRLPAKGGCLTWTGICCSRPSFSGSCMYSCIEAAYPTSSELTRQVVSWYVPAKPQHKAGHARPAAQAAVLSPLAPNSTKQPSLPAAAACRPAARGGQTAGQLHPPEAGCTTIAGVA